MSKEVAELRAEIERLEKWVADLQTGCYVNCVYCGYRYGHREEVPCSMANALKQHIAMCPKHPLSALLRCARMMDHTLGSLLAIRDGATDEFLAGLRAEVQAAIAATTVVPVLEPGEGP